MNKLPNIKINIIVSITTILLFSCQSSRFVPNFSEQILYDYKVIVYSCEGRNKEIHSFEYYNEKEQLVEQVQYEYRAKYIYNTKGQLAEKFHCRMYNCQAGRREILIYDNNGNHIGTYRTSEENINMDTIKVEQIRFYDENNHLIKELSDKGTDVYGKPYEFWKYYIYENDKIANEITMRNNDTVWVGKYFYNEAGYLVSIYRKNGQKYQKETFEYDQSGKLIKEKIEDNTYPLTKDVSFSRDNNSKTFLYNEQGKLIEEIRYNHKGEELLKYKYVYEYEE